MDLSKFNEVYDGKSKMSTHKCDEKDVLAIKERLLIY